MRCFALLGSFIFVEQLQTLLSLSEDQIQDLMLLRRLYIVKRCLLGSQRARLVARMQEPSPDLISAALKASSVATELGNNAAQDRQLFHRITWGVYCGVSHAVCFNAALCKSHWAFMHLHGACNGRRPLHTAETCQPISCGAHAAHSECTSMKMLSATSLQAACLLLA